MLGLEVDVLWFSHILLAEYNVAIRWRLFTNFIIQKSVSDMAI